MRRVWMFGARRCSRLPFALAALAAVALAGGCGGANSNKPAAGSASTSFYTPGVPGGNPQRGGVLRYVTIPFDTLDPERLASDLGAQSAIFDQLVELLPGSETPQPGIARSWTISRDGLTYDFKLRPGVRFSTGQPVTASDVAFTLHRMTTAANQTGQFIFPGEFKSITAVNPLELRFVLHKPVAAMLYNLADPALSILPRSIASRESQDRFGTNPIGSGAFMVKSFSPGKSLELVRNPYYWRSGKPYLDRISYTMIADSNQRILSVRSGQADVAQYVPYSQIGGLRHTPGVDMLVQHGYVIDEVFWNDAKAPMNDVRVRRALAYATPLNSIIKAVYHGYAEPANSIVPKMQYWDPSVPAYAYDIAKAKQLLRSSSAPHGFSTTILVPGGDADMTLLATILQSSWAQIGVTLKIRQVDVGVESNYIVAGNYQMGVYPTGSIFNDVAAPDDSTGLAYLYDNGTHAIGTYLNNPTQERLYDEASSTLDESVRARDFRRLQAITQDEAQMLPIAFAPWTFLVRPQVRDVSSLGGGWLRLDEAYLAR